MKKSVVIPRKRVYVIHGHMVMIFGTSKKTSHKSESEVGRFDSLAALANECGLSSSGSN